MQRLFAGVILTVVAAAPAFPADSPTHLVEDWSRQPDGKTEIPDGWTGHNWGGSRYEFTVVIEGAQRVLRMQSQSDNSTISKEVALDVRRFPILVWRWKIVTLPAGGDSRRRDADDQAAQVYVTFARFPEKVRSRVIGYVWDTTAPSGAIVKSPSASAVTYVIVRSGEAGVGRWWTETRNVYDDYRRIHSEEPPEKINVVSIAVDSNDTRSSAEFYIGEIFFRSP
jgi:Protein of unknown function (DUF3047)